ncbi:MAG: pyridoxamine 5'-phosphate oxidase family protein [Coriobacteriales bacterium]|jgi:uncharacterized pyridoxamine 5'-phosphate oxidase family protein|nr:pyridoxamine 5'-phosphate oxidase family protein [Coriobacteriales bacterium]
MDEVYEFLKKVQVYYLATADGDQPRVRPFGTVDIFEGKLNIQTGKSKDLFRQVLANPLVEISGFDGTVWLRLAATAVPDERIEAQEHLLAAYPQLAAMYTPGDGNSVVLTLTNAVAKFYSMETMAEVNSVSF